MAIADLHAGKGMKRQQIPYLLIIRGSWTKLRRPPGYPIRPDRPHTGAGRTPHEVVSPNLGPLTILDRADNVQYALRGTVYRQLTNLRNRLFTRTKNIRQRPQHNMVMPTAAPITPLTMP